MPVYCLFIQMCLADSLQDAADCGGRNIASVDVHSICVRGCEGGEGGWNRNTKGHSLP